MSLDLADEETAALARLLRDTIDADRDPLSPRGHRDLVAVVVELSRMLSGQPSSEVARGHAEELLAVASRQREA